MFRTLFYLLLTFSLSAFSLKAQEKKQKIDYAKEGYVKAVVIDYKVDNCGFMLELTDKRKSKLNLDSIPAAFKKEKLKVWVKYIVAKKQPMTTCMAGHFCELVDIQKRK